jgi:hypothetical protein
MTGGRTEVRLHRASLTSEAPVLQRRVAKLRCCSARSSNGAKLLPCTFMHFMRCDVRGRDPSAINLTGTAEEGTQNRVRTSKAPNPSDSGI